MFLAHTRWLLSHLCNDYHPHQSLIKKHFKPTKEIVRKGDAYLELKTSDLKISLVKMQQRCVFLFFHEGERFFFTSDMNTQPGKFT